MSRLKAANGLTSANKVPNMLDSVAATASITIGTKPEFSMPLLIASREEAVNLAILLAERS